MQAYSDPRREDEPTALPDVEVWCDRVSEVTCKCGVYGVPFDTAHADSETYCPSCERPAESVEDTDREAWWWWSCSPGCLPDSEPNGPFETEAEALADAREGVEVDGDDFPEDTATVWDSRGFPHVGHLTKQRDAQNGTALYYFPGDFIAGDGTEAWLDPVTAADAEMLADYLSCDDEQWSAVASTEEE